MRPAMLFTHRMLRMISPGHGRLWMPLRSAGLCLALLAGFVMLTGCSSPQTTRLQASDFDQTIAVMVESLSRSEFLAGRTPDSPPAWVVIDKVENLTTDVIPPAEQWMLVARVQSALPLQHFREKYRVMFQITPERHALLRQAGFTGELGTAPQTTHSLTALFMSAPRAGRDVSAGYVTSRREFYYLEYRLVDVVTRETVWNDRFEISRQARGLAID